MYLTKKYLCTFGVHSQRCLYRIEEVNVEGIFPVGNSPKHCAIMVF